MTGWLCDPNLSPLSRPIRTGEEGHSKPGDHPAKDPPIHGLHVLVTVAENCINLSRLNTLGEQITSSDLLQDVLLTHLNG